MTNDSLQSNTAVVDADEVGPVNSTDVDVLKTDTRRERGQVFASSLGHAVHAFNEHQD